MFTNFKPMDPKKDFKGKGVGFDGPEWASTFKALGANLVTVSVPEWYTALERGVTDAQMAPMTFVKDQSFFEVSKYIIDYGIAPANNVVGVINLDKWKSLPPEMRDLMDKAWADLEPKFYDFQTAGAAKARQLAIQKKMEFVKFSGADEKWFLDVFDRTQWNILLDKGVPKKTWNMLRDLAKKP
jgi:TRAP-type C4-dicarboxylate transport system substrate-binding protein